MNSYNKIKKQEKDFCGYKASDKKVRAVLNSSTERCARIHSTVRCGVQYDSFKALPCYCQ